MEVEGGLDNRALVLVVGLKGLKRLSRLSLERKGHPILTRPPRLGFLLLWVGGEANIPGFSSACARRLNYLLFWVPCYPTFLFPGLRTGGFC